MERNDIPISLRMTLAMMCNDRKMVDKLVCEAFESITHRLMAVVNGYDRSDLPFVIATMTITANSLKSLLNADGLGIVDKLVSNTTCMTVDADEFRKQMMEEEGSSEE